MDFVEILETIDRDLGLGLATGNPIPVTRNSCRVVDNILEETPEKESKPYQFREQKFPLAELMYWQQYGITPEILELYKVCSLRDFQSVTADGTQFTYTSSVTEPMYGYKSKRYIKLYRPFSKTRFLYGGNLEIIIVSDWNNYPQKVIHCLLRAEKRCHVIGCTWFPCYLLQQ